MEEKILIKGEFSKKNLLTYILIGFAVISGYFSYYFYSMWQSATWYSDFEPYIYICLILTLAFIISGILVYFIMNKCEITVTDKRVFGKIKFGIRADLPLNQISSIGQGWFKSITVATSSGVIRFWLLENREEVVKEISKLLSKFQGNNNNVTTVIQSNADELKKYKDLLDCGVITQEEFDAKKKELLNL